MVKTTLSRLSIAACAYGDTLNFHMFKELNGTMHAC